MRLIQRFRAPGYNRPVSFAMFIAQWAHQLFLWEKISYAKYERIQNAAYRFFPPKGDQGNT